MKSERRHAIADVEGLPFKLLNDRVWARRLLRNACIDGGATVVGELSHRFEPQGVTVVLVLEESHASFHTWPELGHAYIDVFTCGKLDPMPIVAGILERLRLNGGVGRAKRVSVS